MTNQGTEYSANPETGNIRYMDGSALLRPQSIKGPIRIVAAGIVAISVAIGGFAIYNVADKVVFAAAHEQAEIQQILAKQPSGETPHLSKMVTMSDEETKAYLTQLSPNLYEVPQTGGSKTVDMIKLGDGVDATAASNVYVSGGSNVKAPAAVKALNGTWRVDVDRGSGTVMRIRYSDFTSGSPEAAVRAAMATQGFPEETVTESGLDDSGNTFRAGIATNENGDDFNWRVSAISLSEVYSIKGLPEGAIYVGIKVTR